MNTRKVVIGVLVWEFTSIIMLMISNTIVNGYIAPTMYDITNASTLVNGTLYRQQISPVVSAFNIAMYIFMVLPLIYLFVRMLLKKEQTSPPAYYPGGGF
jgi:hypothetical protein